MGDTKIQWTDRTWNPLRARNKATGEVGWFCEHVSHGCDNCYAEKMNVNTYFGNGLEYKASVLPQLELFLDEKMLDQPLHWRKGKKIFVCSMTDLFGRFVKDEWIEQMFSVMAKAAQHTFQVLTKRPERMREISERVPGLIDWPNVWLGVSVEDQKTADERIPLLLETPATVRWISAEPLLDAVDLSAFMGVTSNITGEREQQYSMIDWVVVGGESGAGARPMRLAWAESIIRRCESAGVPVFMKQLGTIWAQENKAKSFKGGDASEWPYQHILNKRQYPVAA